MESESGISSAVNSSGAGSGSAADKPDHASQSDGVSRSEPQPKRRPAAGPGGAVPRGSGPSAVTSQSAAAAPLAGPAMTANVAVVTGGAQGIGKCISRELLKQGFRVVVADMDAEAGAELVTEYRDLGQITFVQGSVANERDVENLIATAAALGNLCVLVNNAGYFRSTPLAELELDAWNALLGVNLTGPMLCARAALPHLRTTRGCILNIGSTRALMSERNTEAYAASKGGIVALTHALSVSLGPDVRVNCISPGWIETGDWQKSSTRKVPNHSEADRMQHPAGRVGTPMDVAAMVLFLISAEAGFITGQNFVIDGGLTKRMIYVE